MFINEFEKTGKSKAKVAKEITLTGTDIARALYKSKTARAGVAGGAVGALSADKSKGESAGVSALRGAAIGAAGYRGFKNHPHGMVVQSKKTGTFLMTNKGVKVLPKGNKKVLPWDQDATTVVTPSIRKAVGGGAIAGYLTKKYGPKHNSEKGEK